MMHKETHDLNREENIGLAEIKKPLSDVLRPEWVKKNENEGFVELDSLPDFEFDSLTTWSLRVSVVVSGSPSEKAGLQEGDEIMQVDGQAISNPDLGLYVNDKEGAITELSVNRDGENIQLTLQPAWNEQINKWMIGLNFSGNMLGIKLEDVFKEDTSFGFDMLEFEGKNVRGRLEFGEMSEFGLEIKSYIISESGNEDDKSYDIIKRFNTEDTKIYWNATLNELNDLSDAARYNRALNVVQVRNPFHAATPHAILHELRHSWQSNDAKLEEMSYFYDSEIDLTKGDKLLHRKIGMILRLAFGEQIEQDVTDRLSKISEEEDGLKEETVVVGSVTVRDILSLPLMLLERDAEYGALVAMREIKRETGINLLHKDDTGLVDSELDNSLSSIEKLRKSIKTLQETQRYMRKIGISDDCRREMQKMSKEKVHHVNEGLVTDKIEQLVA